MMWLALCAGLVALAPAPVALAGSPVSSNFVVPSENSYKADLLEHVGSTPQLVFFGGSRSTRFDPAFAYRRTHLKAFNLALSNATPLDAWAYANWLYERTPNVHLRWVWGMQTSTFTERPMDPGLVQDPRFTCFFPQWLLRWQARRLPKTAAAMPRHSFLEHERFARNGLLLWNTYDAEQAHGKTLDTSLDEYIRLALSKLGRSDGSVPLSRARVYFEQTLALMNAHGTEPLIVLMPVHPRVLAVLRRHGWAARQARFKAYFTELQTCYRFSLLDFTQISSFGGDPAQFYDGVHIKRANADRAIAAMVRQRPGAFD